MAVCLWCGERCENVYFYWRSEEGVIVSKEFCSPTCRTRWCKEDKEYEAD
jgi:hypothetical protein